MAMSEFKPMLAANPLKDVPFERSTEALAKLPYPLILSPKLDGFRAIIRRRDFSAPAGPTASVISRQLKLLPNLHTQFCFGHDFLVGLDGELIVGSPTNPNAMQATSSGVTTRAGKPKVTFWVFDDVTSPSMPFTERFKSVVQRVDEHQYDLAVGDIQIVPHVQVNNVEQLLEHEIKQLEAGYEGLCLRRPDGLYKYGRSTMNQGWLMKLKRFIDDEATVVGFVEQMHNANELQTNELGYAKRTSHKANKHGKNTFGAFICEWRGMTFQIGTGKNNSLTDEVRALLWAQIKENPKKLLGKRVKFEYFPVGVKEKPRHPKFIGFRSEID